MTNYYKTVMQSYEGDNQITLGMRQDIITVYNELYGADDLETRQAVGVILTAAMKARSFKKFEKCLINLIDLKKYPIELSHYLAGVREFKKGYRKTWPLI